MTMTDSEESRAQIESQASAAVESSLSNSDYYKLTCLARSQFVAVAARLGSENNGPRVPTCAYTALEREPM